MQDPKGKVLYTKSGQEQAQFAFTSTSAGDYRACFSVADMDTALATTIRLDWKTGVAATNWDDIAKKENLDQMATELRKLEQVVKEIHQEMLFFRNREEEMRNLNGVLLRAGFSSVVICMLSSIVVHVSVLQLAF